MRGILGAFVGGVFCIGVLTAAIHSHAQQAPAASPQPPPAVTTPDPYTQALAEELNDFQKALIQIRAIAISYSQENTKLTQRVHDLEATVAKYENEKAHALPAPK